VPNTKCANAGANTNELIFAPAAAALTIIDTEDAGKPLANGLHDPNEPRLPAGQPGGGQWTTADAVPWESSQIGPSVPI